MIKSYEFNNYGDPLVNDVDVEKQGETYSIGTPAFGRSRSMSLTQDDVEMIQEYAGDVVLDTETENGLTYSSETDQYRLTNWFDGHEEEHIVVDRKILQKRIFCTE